MIDFPHPFPDPEDCEQSLFFFRGGSALARERQAPSVTREVICVYRVCRWTD